MLYEQLEQRVAYAKKHNHKDIQLSEAEWFALRGIVLDLLDIFEPRTSHERGTIECPPAYDVNATIRWLREQLPPAEWKALQRQLKNYFYGKNERMSQGERAALYRVREKVTARLNITNKSA